MTPLIKAWWLGSGIRPAPEGLDRTRGGWQRRRARLITSFARPQSRAPRTRLRTQKYSTDPGRIAGEVDYSYRHEEQTCYCVTDDLLLHSDPSPTQDVAGSVGGLTIAFILDLSFE
jgi:hypothetical protein